MYLCICLDTRQGNCGRLVGWQNVLERPGIAAYSDIINPHICYSRNWNGNSGGWQNVLERPALAAYFTMMDHQWHTCRSAIQHTGGHAGGILGHLCYTRGIWSSVWQGML